MDDSIKQEIKQRWREILPSFTSPAKVKDQWICDLNQCQHGANGDGLKENPRIKDGTGLKCFGCQWSGDILEYVMEHEKVDFPTALRMCADILRISIDQPSSWTPRATAKDDFADMDAKQMDFTKYYERCSQTLKTNKDGREYLKSRGIDPDLAADRFDIGFDPEADPGCCPGADPFTKKVHPYPRIIIPISKSYYIGRAIDNKLDKGLRKMNSKGSSSGIFNEDALKYDSPVFVVEGALDALSICQSGGCAIALNSASNARLLIERLKNNPPKAPLVLCGDNDFAGQKALQTMKEGLDKLGIWYTVKDINCGQKDANDALVADKDRFREVVGTISDYVEAQYDYDQQHPEERKEAAAAEESSDAAADQNMTAYIDAQLVKDVARFRDGSGISTGFHSLDGQLGGINSGLYIIGAIPSLGKTTLMSQIADNIAASGHHVLFFSLEMSRLEILSKSVARTMAKSQGIDNATNSLQLRRGDILTEEMAKDALSDYRSTTGDTMTVIEGSFRLDADQIVEKTKKYIDDHEGERPVVVIDYLQAIPPSHNLKMAGTRDAVDYNVRAMKNMTTDLNIPVFLISSFNRSNYLTPVDFESFKESGGIEYTGDVLIGLEYDEIEREDVFADPKATLTKKRDRFQELGKQTERNIRLVCLKNRYGNKFYTNFVYTPACDYFRDAPLVEAADNFSKTKKKVVFGDAVSERQEREAVQRLKKRDADRKLWSAVIDKIRGRGEFETWASLSEESGYPLSKTKKLFKDLWPDGTYTYLLEQYNVSDIKSVPGERKAVDDPDLAAAGFVEASEKDIADMG